jgi:hypothetical protein
MLDKYKYESGGGFDTNGNPTPAGTAVLGPYSPASWGASQNRYDGGRHF